MNKANGGSAFPTVEANYHNENTRGGGLSIRDYFAAKAMAGMLSDPTVACDGVRLARIAYSYADAMLAERDR